MRWTGGVAELTSGDQTVLALSELEWVRWSPSGVDRLMVPDSA